MAINSGFSHKKWWFSIAMLVYQRVYIGYFSQCLLSNSNPNCGSLQWDGTVSKDKLSKTLDHLDLIETATKSKGGSAQLVDTVTTPAKSRVSGVSPVLLGLWPPLIASVNHQVEAIQLHPTTIFCWTKVPIFDDVNSASLTKKHLQL